MTIAPNEITPGELLRRTLAAHGVKSVHATDFRGPTITQHAFALEAGTKVAKVESLSKDLALALGLDDVRIVAPIPGTNYVGVEVPRAQRETVTYADFIENTDIDDLPDPSNALPFPVGVGIGGDAIWADLAKLPHLLIAGSTGSGKSVALNSLITSLIDHRTPDEVRLWLVDPKRVELGIFERAPHVDRVATDIRDAIEVLESVADIMDYRYQEFETYGVRNIDEYNDQIDGASGPRLPYHVVVVDELADLMMQAKTEVEPLIVRIAQLARAAGIHLVLATQRPTVNVVTGLIAANVVSRWVFAVRSSTDSKVALEETGAQALYGQGDSLWFPAGATKPVRVQGVWTDRETLEGILDAAEDQHPDVESSDGAGAASEDDDYDLGLEEESITSDEVEVEMIVTAERFGGEPTLEPDIDFETGSNLEDPDEYNAVAQLAPVIAAMVEESLAERERTAARNRTDQEMARSDRWDRFIQRAILLPAVVVGVLFAVTKIFGA